MPIPALAFLAQLTHTMFDLLRDRQTRKLVLAVVIVVAAGTWVYHLLEGWSLFDSLYFTVITLTTIGYGDLSPQTDAGKLFTIVYVLIGLGLLATFISLVAQRQRLALDKTQAPTPPASTPIQNIGTVTETIQDDEVL